jgi:hypothetical protein
LWKEKPVVAGKAGGIPIQFPPEYQGYLVGSIEACAERVLHLLQRPGERGAFGRAGREHVRRNFLLPRLVCDELRLIRDLLSGTPLRGGSPLSAARREGTVGKSRFSTIPGCRSWRAQSTRTTY